MIRSLAFAGVAALAAIPQVALSAPTGGVIRPAPAPHRDAGGASHDRSAPDVFRVPFDVDVHPRPLSSDMQPPEFEATPRHWWTANPAYVLYQPGVYEPACLLNNTSANAWTPLASSDFAAATSEVEIGSLVDDKSKSLLSSPTSYAADMTGSGTASTAPSSLSFQYGLQPTGCGANFTGL
jgi:hypothetical protein